MSIEHLIGKMITGTLLGGSKQSSGASRFLTGGGGFLNASTLLTLGGLAWGVAETMQQQAAPNTAPAPPAGPPSYGAAPPPVAAPPPPLPTAASVQMGAPEPMPASAPLSGPPLGTAVPPPLPVMPPMAAAVPVPPGAERLVRLMISAARADGELSDVERQTILEHARAAGVEALVAAEIERATPLGDVTAGITDQKQREDLYVLAYAIVRADESVTGSERIYLAQLAARLGLDDPTVARLERDAATRIDKA